LGVPSGRRSVTLLLATAGLVALVLCTSAASRRWGQAAAARVVGVWTLLERRSVREEEPPFAHLAASQVGYGPRLRKEFTSPTPFASFAVEDEGSGTVAFRGGGQLRAVQTDLLGSTTTVFIGDFSPLSTAGRYRVVADNGLSSHPFAVGADVFGVPLRAVQRWFYYQRAFAPVIAPYAEGPWTHPSDADKAPPGIRGGWHDAGDFSLYSAPLNAALFWLLQAFSDFSPRADDTNIPESGNGIPDLLDEARWGLDWLLSVQDTSGGFRNTTCQDSYGPYGTNTPNSVPPYKNGEVGTLATARAVGNLAYASLVYRPFDAAFAQRCLTAAQAGMRYLEAHRGEDTDGPTCPAARRDGDREVGRRARSFAAAGMLLATGEGRFRDAFEASFAEPDYDAGFLHLSGAAALLYLRAPAGDAARKQALWARLRVNADTALAEGQRHPFGWATRYHWGSLGAALQRTGLNSAPFCVQNPDAAAADCEQALASLHYALGRNLKQYCYVSGLPGVTRGMRAGFHQWLATLQAQPRNFPGMVAGGPCREPEKDDTSVPYARPVPIWGYWGDPAFPRDARTPVDGRYTDNDSWSTNEPSVEWEAESVYHLQLAQWLARRVH
jgi:endoglucanase